MKAHWLLALLLAAGVPTACSPDSTPSAQDPDNAKTMGRFEVVRERTNSQGGLEIRVRAERLDAADQIARKIAALKKEASQRIARIEFIGMKDPSDAPTRRLIDNP